MTRTVVKAQRVADVFLVAFGIAINVKFLRDGTTNQCLGAQGEVTAEGQVEIDADTARELGDVVALHHTVAVGDGGVGFPGTLRVCLIAHLAQVGILVLDIHVLGGTRKVVTREGCLIVGLQALPDVIILTAYIISKVAEVLGRLCPDPEAATHAYILVEEVGSFGIDHRGGTELELHLLAHTLELEIFTA